MGSGGNTPTFLTSALEGGEWLVSNPSWSTPWERGPNTHWIGGWVGPELVLTLWRRSASHTPDGNQILAVEPIACYYTDWAIPVTWLGGHNLKCRPPTATIYFSPPWVEFHFYFSESEEMVKCVVWKYLQNATSSNTFNFYSKKYIIPYIDQHSYDIAAVNS
jgi:hypothetical protein